MYNKMTVTEHNVIRTDPSDTVIKGDRLSPRFIPKIFAVYYLDYYDISTGMRCGRYWLDRLRYVLARGRRFESQVLNNIFVFRNFFLIHSFMPPEARNKYF